MGNHGWQWFSLGRTGQILIGGLQLNSMLCRTVLHMATYDLEIRLPALDIDVVFLCHGFPKAMTNSL